jgi:shikimate dehydrogenase
MPQLYSNAGYIESCTIIEAWTLKQVQGDSSVISSSIWSQDLPVSTPSQSFGEAKLLTGLAGREILASRSPWMHEREADALGIRLIYSLFDFEAQGWDDTALPRLLEQAAWLGYSGINITFPFKQVVIAHLDTLSEGARRIGAVNTVSFAGGKLTGYNTDVTGFADSFKHGLPGVATDRVVQFGAGGAGSATAHALLDSGVEHVALSDTDPAKLSALYAKLARDYGTNRVSVVDDVAASVASADGIVNATPMGMAHHPGLPLPAELIEHRHWVADIVYFPLDTALLTEARKRGCQTLNGSGMAVEQAASAFEIFTGLTVDRARMHKSFLDFVGEPATLAA